MHKNVKYIFTMTDIYFLYIKEVEKFMCIKGAKAWRLHMIIIGFFIM